MIDAGRKKRRTSAGEEPVIGLDEAPWAYLSRLERFSEKSS